MHRSTRKTLSACAAAIVGSLLLTPAASAQVSSESLALRDAHALVEEFNKCKIDPEKDPKRTINYCTRVIDSGKFHKKKLMDARYNRGIAYVTLGDLDMALTDLKEANRLSKISNQFEPLRSTASRMKRRSAIPRDIGHNLAITYFKRGKTFYDSGDLPAAISDFSNALKNRSGHVDSYVYRANSYRQQGKTSKALSDYSEALSRAPSFREAYEGRAKLYADAGNYDRAVKDYGKAIKAGGRVAASYQGRCWSKVMLGKAKSALKDCNKAIKARPKFARAFEARGLAYLALGKAERAKKDLDKAIELKGNAGHAYASRARVHELLGNIDQATADRQTARSQAEDQAEYDSWLSEIAAVEKSAGAD